MGSVYALVLAFLLVEPVRGQSEATKPAEPDPIRGRSSSITAWFGNRISGGKVERILTNRTAFLLLPSSSAPISWPRRS